MRQVHAGGRCGREPEGNAAGPKARCSVEEADTGGHTCHHFSEMSGAGKAIEADGGSVSAQDAGQGVRGEKTGVARGCRQALGFFMS